MRQGCRNKLFITANGHYLNKGLYILNTTTFHGPIMRKRSHWSQSPMSIDTWDYLGPVRDKWGGLGLVWDAFWTSKGQGMKGKNMAAPVSLALKKGLSHGFDGLLMDKIRLCGFHASYIFEFTAKRNIDRQTINPKTGQNPGVLCV